MNAYDRGSRLEIRDRRPPIREVPLVMLLFASMGAITWAIRGTTGWGGIDGTFVPGLTWGVLWWYVAWRNGIDARGIPLWLGLGIALGGDLGYGQYISWIRGMFNVGDEVFPIEPWIGFVWLGICGVGWGAPGGIILGWALAGQASLNLWLARLVLPIGGAILARMTVQAWPWLFFPHWHAGFYEARAAAEIEATADASTQQSMILRWLVVAVLACSAAYLNVGNRATRKFRRGFSVVAVAAAALTAAPLVQWLFFPEDLLGLFEGTLDAHLDRTVYTNSQNAIAVGWWISALLVAAATRDRQTVAAGLILGGGFGVGFPLAAAWCLAYGWAPTLIDWWKMWELNSGFYLGLLYAIVFYWAYRQTDDHRDDRGDDEAPVFEQFGTAAPMALAALVILRVASREYFATVGLLLGAFYVVAIGLTLRNASDGLSRRRGVSFAYSIFLLVFMMAWGASAQAGVVAGLYGSQEVGQYDWPAGRIALFVPFGLLIVCGAILAVRGALRDPCFGIPPGVEAPRVVARLVNLMTYTGIIGAISIWPSKINVFYAVLLALALFALTRLQEDRQQHSS